MNILIDPIKLISIALELIDGRGWQASTFTDSSENLPGEPLVVTIIDTQPLPSGHMAGEGVRKYKYSA